MPYVTDMSLLCWSSWFLGSSSGEYHAMVNTARVNVSLRIGFQYSRPSSGFENSCWASLHCFVFVSASRFRDEILHRIPYVKDCAQAGLVDSTTLIVPQT